MIKTRVYEVARELGLDNRELVTKLATLGIPVRNHMSSIDPADADRVKRAIEKEKQQNVVEERIRPTVVRRRTMKRDDEPEAAVAAAAAPVPEPAPARGQPVVRRGGAAQAEAASPAPSAAPKPAASRAEPARQPSAAQPAARPAPAA